MAPQRAQPLFPRWSNTLYRAGIAALLGGLLAIPACFMIGARTRYVTGQGRPVRQPVEFDHRHHVGDDGIDCRYCHDLVETSRYAGIPPTDRCLRCHSQIWRDSPLLEPVWRSHETGRPIPWVRVHRLPDFVYFDHAAHVRSGVGCVSCHGRVDRMARVQQVAPLQMAWCLGCHRDPTPHLRPRELVTSPEPYRADAATRRALARRYAAAPGTDCTTCHR